jgi:transcriptional regulator with XRE-family HTH domain
MSLGENIYKHRTSRSQSQTDLADLLEVSRQSVSKWENDSAVPDLDKLIRISKIFDISLDELVFGEKAKKEPQPDPPAPSVQTVTVSAIPIKWVVGVSMLIFGMVLFLLSIFWGDSLYFGEAFGELFSLVSVLFSLSLIATDNFSILSVCAIIYFIYTVIYFSTFHVGSITNYLFILAAGVVILVWFISYGLNATKGVKFKSAIESDDTGDVAGDGTKKE